MFSNNELDDRQRKAVELLATGETVTSTAQQVGVNRKTISEWKKNPVFKAELDKYVTVLKLGVEKKILSNINPLLDKLIKIALKSDSDNTSLNAIIYAINRVCGTPTNKTQDVSGDKPDDIPKNIEEMIDTLDQKVVKLPVAAKK